MLRIYDSRQQQAAKPQTFPIIDTSNPDLARIPALPSQAQGFDLTAASPCQEFSLSEGVHLAGRSEICDIKLRAKCLDQVHLMIKYDSNAQLGLMVQDNHTDKGTFQLIRQLDGAQCFMELNPKTTYQYNLNQRAPIVLRTEYLVFAFSGEAAEQNEEEAQEESAEESHSFITQTKSAFSKTNPFQECSFISQLAADDTKKPEVSEPSEPRAALSNLNHAVSDIMQDETLPLPTITQAMPSQSPGSPQSQRSPSMKQESEAQSEQPASSPKKSSKKAEQEEESLIQTIQKGPQQMMGTTTLLHDLSDICKPSEDKLVDRSEDESEDQAEHKSEVKSEGKLSEKSIGFLEEIIGDVSQDELPQKLRRKGRLAAEDSPQAFNLIKPPQDIVQASGEGNRYIKKRSRETFENQPDISNFNHKEENSQPDLPQPKKPSSKEEVGETIDELLDFGASLDESGWIHSQKPQLEGGEAKRLKYSEDVKLAHRAQVPPIPKESWLNKLEFQPEKEDSQDRPKPACLDFKITLPKVDTQEKKELEERYNRPPLSSQSTSKLEETPQPHTVQELMNTANVLTMSQAHRSVRTIPKVISKSPTRTRNQIRKSKSKGTQLLKVKEEEEDLKQQLERQKLEDSKEADSSNINLQRRRAKNNPFYSKPAKLRVMLSGEAATKQSIELVTGLGGEVVKSASSEFDVLVVTTMKRTSKLLHAVALNAQIVNKKWLLDSAKAGRFVCFNGNEPEGTRLDKLYRLRDSSVKEFEEVQGCSLKRIYLRCAENRKNPGQKRLLEDHVVHVKESALEKLDEEMWKSLIAKLGGAYSSERQKATIIISEDTQNPKAGGRYRKKAVSEYRTDLIFKGVLQNCLDFDKFRLS